MFRVLLAGIGRLLAGKWLAVVIAIAAAAVVATLFLYVRGAERAKEKVVLLEDRLTAAEAASALNSAETEKCLLLNQANAAEAQAQAERARQAAERVRLLERDSNRRVTEVDREANTLRAVGLSCPAIDGDFRRWMLNTSP